MHNHKWLWRESRLDRGVRPQVGVQVGSGKLMAGFGLQVGHGDVKPTF